MYSHAPQDYVCLFCSLVQNVENEHSLARQSDVVYQDETVTAFTRANGRTIPDTSSSSRAMRTTNCTPVRNKPFWPTNARVMRKSSEIRQGLGCDRKMSETRSFYDGKSRTLRRLAQAGKLV